MQHGATISLCAGASYAIPWKHVWPLQVRHIQWTHVVRALDVNSGGGDSRLCSLLYSCTEKDLLIKHSAPNLQCEGMS